jgi:DNA topoisomerase-1
MIKAKDLNQRKIATVCYLILKLAMRVGDEKDKDEADTVGASTLRVEHIKFPEKDGKKYIEFNFLGKDSVPWQKAIEINSPDTKALFDNLGIFMKNKRNESDQIFDNINSAKVNSFLRKIDPANVPGLTAKVFRTYLATKIVKEALKNPPFDVNKGVSESKKIYIAKIANLKAAIACNHKKGIDPNNPASKKALERFAESINKKEEAIEKIRNDIISKKWKTEKQKEKLESRIEKIQYQLKLQKETRDYNLGTSLRNYIDPRVMKNWLDYVDLDWKRIYTSTLQKKFRWIESSSSSSSP